MQVNKSYGLILKCLEMSAESEMTIVPKGQRKEFRGDDRRL